MITKRQRIVQLEKFGISKCCNANLVASTDAHNNLYAKCSNCENVNPKYEMIKN